ncbi:MAG: hypothetical protein KGO96_07420 [Elusimicrobia bacterium]|nr:hypothetical protein [Elusimicrobiota bacterium]
MPKDNDKDKNPIAQIAKSIAEEKSSYTLLDPNSTDEEDLKKFEGLNISPMMKSVISLVGKVSPDEGTIERLGFTSDPNFFAEYSSIFIPKTHLVPDFVRKKNNGLRRISRCNS